MVNDFMKDKNEAYFGSFLPIYFFDAYGVKLNYLPLSAYQDFMLILIKNGSLLSYDPSLFKSSAKINIFFKCKHF